jgi:hypothetical protein
MKLIQIVLIGMLLGLVLYFRLVRRGGYDRLVVMLLACLSIVLVAFPQLSEHVASLVGVGRGVDVVIYVAFVVVLFAGLLMYVQMRRLERHVTELARTIAILGAKAESHSHE